MTDSLPAWLVLSEQDTAPARCHCRAPHQGLLLEHCADGRWHWRSSGVLPSSLCQRKGLALGTRAQILVSPAMVSVLPWPQVSESSETLSGALLASPFNISRPQGSVLALLSMLLLMEMKAEVLLALSCDHTVFCT